MGSIDLGFIVAQRKPIQATESRVYEADKRLIGMISNSFVISFDATRVGMVSFAKGRRRIFLNDYHRAGSFNEAVEQLTSDPNGEKVLPKSS